MLRGRGGLGRGLGALLPGGAAGAAGVAEVDLDAIAPNPRQPRHHVEPGQLEELAASIRAHGVIQPLVVRAIGGDGGPRRYELIAGERRWHASRLAGLTRVPVVVKDATPQQVLELALVENIQRADLNPLEEAAAYRQLMDEFGLTQEQVALRVGKSRATVANTLRLLNLAEPTRAALAEGTISEGHARALVGLTDDVDQARALRQVRNLRLTVRQTEELVRRAGDSEPMVVLPDGIQAIQAEAPRDERTLETRALEDQVRAALGTRVNLIRSGQGGRLVLHFYSEEELQGLLDRLLGS